ncbi:peptidase inhibitor family I36 protein [Yersinia rochesterensis]|uniref:peptidase inhibitor family I36 protein n=1 Tax=Yersinia rochesterensis TaxID=1604335 RepID=UPI00285348AD|nr:peptidase inhibitor family I36 protein [Yersinia rochesterensis]MDR5016830.1 peptidase inhibitor family I36 protein [Yersinia rochesterensis]
MRIVIKLLIMIVSIISQPAYSYKAKVCFYELADFGGESFCSAESESNSVFNDGFNNKIESISVPPGMIVTLYDGVDFSGKKTTLKNDINLPELKLSGLYNTINSYEIEPAICFYTEDKFQGDSTCLASNQQIDLYNDSEPLIESGREVLPIHNDSIKSITVPQGMMAKIYKNDNFHSPFFSLTESMANHSLKALRMSNAITSIRVSKNEGLSCDQQCVISDSYRIDLIDAFGKYWDDERLKNKQILLVFNTSDLGEHDNYTLNLYNGPNITLNKRQIILSDHKMTNKFYFDRYINSDNLSFIIQIQKDTVQTQFIQTLKHNVVDTSPIISFNWDSETNIRPEIIINNFNEDTPLILEKSILTADTGDKKWEKRDLTQISQIICFFTPFLNIYNYLTQDKCQQLDSIIFSADKFFHSNTKGKTLHIAGKSTPLKNKDFVDKEISDSISNNMTLTYIDNTTYSQSLSLPATIKACNISIYSILSSRQIRQVRPPCIDWTLDIMTDFTLLFGNSLETWNSDFFGRVIDSTIRTGSTGVAVQNTELESRLIKNIREKITDNSHENSIRNVKSAFDYAQLSYINYSIYYSSSENPSAVELLPLGIYELLLDTFIYTQTIPTIMEQGIAVEHPELEFEVEIIPTLSPEEEKRLSDIEIANSQAMRKKLRETIAQWGQEYQGTHMEEASAASASDTNTSLSKLLHAGHIVTSIIHRRLLIQRPGEIYIVVKLRGQIVTIIVADRFNSRNEVELVASATFPNFVLSPDRDGTVRGAGTAAVRELARYLQQQSARTLYSEVISQPSARVKQKVGFTFIGAAFNDEL